MIKLTPEQQRLETAKRQLEAALTSLSFYDDCSAPQRFVRLYEARESAWQAAREISELVGVIAK